jgi:cytochrome c553
VSPGRYLRGGSGSFSLSRLRERGGVRAVSRALALATGTALTLASGAQAQLSPQARAGQDKARACMVCHGQLGISNVPNAPHLAGQPAIYLVEQLKAYRSGRRANEVMAVIARPLSDADIEDLAAWYSSIRIEATAP